MRCGEQGKESLEGSRRTMDQAGLGNLLVGLSASLWLLSALPHTPVSPLLVAQVAVKACALFLLCS